MSKFKLESTVFRPWSLWGIHLPRNPGQDILTLEDLGTNDRPPKSTVPTVKIARNKKTVKNKPTTTLLMTNNPPP